MSAEDAIIKVASILAFAATVRGLAWLYEVLL